MATRKTKPLSSVKNKAEFMRLAASGVEFTHGEVKKGGKRPSGKKAKK